MSDPGRRVLNYLRTVGGRARVDRVMEATGLDRETILRSAGRPPARPKPNRPLQSSRDDHERMLIDCIWH